VPPDYVLLQVHHYLAVTGLSYAYVAVLIGGQDYRHYLVERDQEIIDYLIKIESDFWKLVENRTPPEIDGSQSSTEVLNILYKNSKPEQIELPPTTLELIQQFEQAQAEEKAAKERKEEAANKLKALLGENEVGAVGERLVTWKQVVSNRLDSKALKDELPDIYEKYCKESISRRFAIK
jgi:predicted phage-related endonuclease